MFNYTLLKNWCVHHNTIIQTPNTTYQWHSQRHRKYGVSSNLIQELMAGQTLHIQTNQPAMGPFLNRSLCRSKDQAVAKVRILASGSGCYPRRCVLHLLNDIPESLQKSS
jgi:hypothetical protein